MSISARGEFPREVTTIEPRARAALASDKRLVIHSDALVAASDMTIVVIDKRLLFRECLSQCLRDLSGHNVLSYATVDEWIDSRDDHNDPAPLVILWSASGRTNDPQVQRDLALLAQCPDHPPAILLSDVEDPDPIIEALSHGARGYIPTSLTLEIALEAVHLVRAGGVFVPADSLMSARRAGEVSADRRQSSNSMFTARQAAVVEALRRGKANKIIAYELNMRESTVKVHVRNIMKKLNARNRTQVAFMMNGLVQGDDG